MKKFVRVLATIGMIIILLKIVQMIKDASKVHASFIDNEPVGI